MPIISAQRRGPKRRRLTSSLGASLSLAHFHGFPFSLSSLKNRTKPITVHGSFCQKLPSVCFLKNGAVADFKRAIIVSGYGQIEFLGNPYDLGCWFGEERFYGAISLGGPKPKAWIAHQWNKFIRWHCERAPLGFGSVSQEGLGWDDRWNSAHSEDGNLELAAQEPKKVLILMSDTGGGHRASAEAIKATFELEYGDQFNVTIVDLWKEHTPWPFNQVPNTYSFLVKHETLWKFTFHGTRPRLVHQTNFAATSIFIAREVAKGLLKYKPDVIVSVHPLMQHIPLRILKSKGLLDKIPFTTVITDLSTCHPTWFHKLTTICFCPTKEVANKAYKAGLKPSQVRVHGLPVRPSFCKPARPKNELRKELEMDEELPAVLLMGGGEGMGPVEATARALGEALVDEPGGRPFGQLVIICGRNKRLVEKLKSHEWSIPVQIRGFVTNISDWMSACDCIITKAGPGTIAEAMIRGLPLLINDYIAGQEAGNVPYVVDNGAGKYCEDPKEIASTISQWFSTKSDEFKQMALNAARLARPNAVFNIVHDLAELAQQRTDLKKFRIPVT